MLDRRSFVTGLTLGIATPGLARPAPVRTARQLLAAARRQIGVTVSYDPSYTVLAFPGGDVPRSKGVCTDVVIRAYRDAFGLDLQALVNADMRADFAAYPKRWGLHAPDRNIDHRRVPNLATWFTRHHASLPLPDDPWGWQPGDIFTALIDHRLPHIGFISDRRGQNAWQILHNIGAGTREEDFFSAWPLTGRYRWAIA